MPESYLWLANHLGNAFTLGTSHRKFTQLENTWDDAVTVKRLSASHWCAWAIGHDHRVYIYILSSDVPIRVPETTYENQRWTPFHGFSKKGLIMTDRGAWSNEFGTVYRPKESVRLPSAHWEWEGDWLIDDNLRGEVVGIEGWQYSLDFPGIFTPEKHWNSFVRRRKWIRFRRFSSTDVWARISDMEVVEKAECFIDISVGGFLLPSQPAGFLSVWGITNSGHVYVRTDVNHDNPEGSTWQEIDIANHLGIINVSVGASNLIWAITWDGSALVRTEVNRNNVYGLGWAQVEYPDQTTRMMQVSVGKNAVWAISREGKVWFRKGTCGDDMFWNDQSAIGVSWVEMVGEMSQITVSCNDQVFAIDMSGKTVYFRTAVTRSDLTGKTWQPVSLHEDLTALKREGLLSEGDMCYCGDENTPCPMHSERRQRCSSTATSSSSLSTTTNNEDSSSETFMSPLQPLALPPAWQRSQFIFGEEDVLDRDISSEGGSSQPSSLTQVSATSCPALVDAPSQSSVFENQDQERAMILSMPNSISLNSLTPSTSQTSTLSHGSSSDDTTIGKQVFCPVASSIVSAPLLEQAGVTVSVSSYAPQNECASLSKQISMTSSLKDNVSPSELSQYKNCDTLIQEGGQVDAVPNVAATNIPVSILRNDQSADSEKENENPHGTDNAESEDLVQETSGHPLADIPLSDIQMHKTNSTSKFTDLPEADQYLQEQESESFPKSVCEPCDGDDVDEHSNICESTDQETSSVRHLVERLHSFFPSALIMGTECTESIQVPTAVANANSQEDEADLCQVNEKSIRASTTLNDQNFRPVDQGYVEEMSEMKTRHRKKSSTSKERRPKIIDFSLNDPGEDSIVFRSAKGKKKKREKKTKAVQQTYHTPDMISVESDQTVTEQAIDIATVSALQCSADVPSAPSISLLSPSDNLDKHNELSSVEPQSSDEVDAPLPTSHSSMPDDSSKMDQFRLEDASSFQTTFPNLQTLSEELTSSTGYMTNTAISMYIAPEVCGTDIEEIIDMRKPQDDTSCGPGIYSADPKLSCQKDTQDLSNQDQPASFSDPSMDNDQSNIALEHFIVQEHVPEIQERIYNVQQETVPSQKYSQSFSTDSQQTENINLTVLPGKEYVKENSIQDNIVDSGAPKTERDRDVSEKSKVSTEVVIEETDHEHSEKATHGVDSPDQKEPSAETRDKEKKMEYISHRFNSLDSTSGSDEIIDFVTDLMSDDDALEGGNDNDKEKPSQKDSMSVPETTTSAARDHQNMPATVLKSSSSSHISMGNESSESSHGPHSGEENSGEANSVDNYNHCGRISSSAGDSLSPTVAGSIPEIQPQSMPYVGLQPARKVSKYHRSSSSSFTQNTPPPTEDSVPMTPLTMAQPRLCWRWLDATSLVIDDPAAVEWLSKTNKEMEPKKKAIKISRILRDDIMRKIQDRNRKENHKFKNIEQAISRTTWVKKASMHMFLYGRHNRWVLCNVELEHGISNVSDGCLTVHYEQKRQQKHLQLSLTEITCVKVCSDLDIPTGFTIYTSMTNIIHQPLMLQASSENEAADWMGYLCAANATAWNMNRAIPSSSVWSCTFTGDVFVSAVAEAVQKPFDLCWGQHGGHMSLIETGPSGVTWGTGFDKMPYVYNNGYGGAINAGVSEMSDNTQQITDYHRVYVYENQKWFPVLGWCSKGVFHHDFHWLTESGRSVASKDAVKLPSSKWQWISEWAVDFTTPGGVDTNGWQYSTALYGPFQPHQHLRSSYRRRRWIRRCKISLVGPWQTAGSLGLLDISIQIDPNMSGTDPLVMWAVGANGDVLCRNGVTASNPLGRSWIHVATDLDKPFKSISVGGNYRVWGIASDGSAWFRPGVTPYNPAGTCWLQVVPPPPSNFLLHQISAGATTVWAVDTGDNLWRRQNITPTFPEGTDWEWVASRVKRVSVGPRDQVWIVADALFNKMKHGAGVIYNRLGISSSKPSGSDWEVVIGSGWAHVSVRGMREVKLEDSTAKSYDDEVWN